MHTLTIEQMNEQPQRLLEGAQRGEAVRVTRDGQPVMLTVPLGKGIESQQVRFEMAAALFDGEQISLGLAARIAGLSYAEMTDQLSQRGIDVIRLAPGELERELAAFGN